MFDKLQLVADSLNTSCGRAIPEYATS